MTFTVNRRDVRGVLYESIQLVCRSVGKRWHILSKLCTCHSPFYYIKSVPGHLRSYNNITLKDNMDTGMHILNDSTYLILHHLSTNVVTIPILISRIPKSHYCYCKIAFNSLMYGRYSLQTLLCMVDIVILGI